MKKGILMIMVMLVASLGYGQAWEKIVAGSNKPSREELGHIKGLTDKPLTPAEADARYPLKAEAISQTTADGLYVGLSQIKTVTPLAINGNRTLQLSDAGKTITASSASTITITVPPDVFAANTYINFIQGGTGDVTFDPGSGVTLLSEDNLLSIGAQNAGATLVQTETANIWRLIGRLK